MKYASGGVLDGRDPFRFISIAVLRSVASAVAGICARPRPDLANNPMPPVTQSRRLRVSKSPAETLIWVSIAELRLAGGSTTVTTVSLNWHVQLFGLGAIIRMDL